MSSLRECVAYVLGAEAAGLPGTEQALREWLAQRGLGLVPVSDPAAFSWPGPFLARGEREWTVLFGVPPGPLLETPDGAGTFSPGGGRGHDLTLVAAEVLEEVGLEPIEARRNLIVRGVDLDALRGRRFRVGAVQCLGQRRCEPCAHLERLTRPGVLRALAHRGGLRADILRGGDLHVGDPVEALE